MYKRYMLLIISGMLACSLIGLVCSVSANAPSRAFALMYKASPTVTVSPTASTPCITIGHSIPSCSPFVTATKPPIPYSLQQGTSIQIVGTSWTANATVELYVLPARDVTSASENNGLCPSQSVLNTRNVAHSARAMTSASGGFSAQVTLPATLKTGGPYSMCISVTSSGQNTNLLLFLINVKANPQLQTGNVPTTGNAASFSFNLSIIALILALIALLLYFISPRQPAAPHGTNRRNAS